MRLIRTFVLVTVPTYALFVAGMVTGQVPPIDPLLSIALLAGFAAYLAVIGIGMLALLGAWALRTATRRLLPAGALTA